MAAWLSETGDLGLQLETTTVYQHYVHGLGARVADGEFVARCAKEDFLRSVCWDGQFSHRVLSFWRNVHGIGYRWSSGAWERWRGSS